jgi:hypothetical protein
MTNRGANSEMHPLLAVRPAAVGCRLPGDWRAGVRGLCLVLWLALQSNGWAQTQALPKAQPHSPVRPSADAEPWDYSLTVDGYLISNQNGYAQPTFTADHRWLHLEARYNYEDFRTGSLWAGYNFSWGKTWQFEVTPMIGGVFGRANGIAPGCEASVGWKILEFSIDNEYVFDTNSKTGNFYYSWPQFTITPVKWFRFGAVAQHTAVFETKLNVQQGFFVGFHRKLRDHKKIEFTTYVFDPGSSSASAVLELGTSF